MMEHIRSKLERAQQRLVHRHAVESATPGSSRYYPPNYTSTKARTPAPAVQSVKLEDLSLHVAHEYTEAAGRPPPSSSGYLGVYPPQPQSAAYRSHAGDPYAASQRRHHPNPQPSQRDRPPVPASSTAPPATNSRPTRQAAPPPSAVPSSSVRHSSRRDHRQQYPPELQYRSSSRNTAAPPRTSSRGQEHYGTPLSTSAPFLVYSNSSSRQLPHGTSQKPSHQQHPPTSAIEVAAFTAKANHTQESSKDAPPPSALRSAMQPPPSSRVRFEEHPSESDEQRARRHEREAEKAKERQREKDRQLRDVLRQERQKRSVSRDAAESHEPGERGERTRRGSLPTPPKSEIDVAAFEQAALALPVSPSGRNRRSGSVAAPPKSAIQASAFDEAPVRRRSLAAEECEQLPFNLDSLDFSDKKSSTKREASSDEDDFTTPPTSPSSGASSGPGSVSTKEEAPQKHESTNATDEAAANPESTNPPDDVIPVQVRAVEKDYDDVFVSNQESSPTKKQFLSIWEEEDEDKIISSNQMLSPKQDPQQFMREKGERELGEEVVSNQERSPKKESAEAIVSNQEALSPAVEPPAQQQIPTGELSPKKKAVPELGSAQELSPVRRSAVSSRTAAPNSRPQSSARPDLRSRINAAIQAFNAPEPVADGTPPRTPASEPRVPRPASPVMRSSAAFQRPPSTAAPLRPTMTPTVTRPRPPLPPPSPHALAGVQTQRRLRHKEPLELKRQLPPQIGVLAGLASGPTTFTLDEFALYEIEWKVGEFGFSFQRVYAESEHEGQQKEMYLRMLLNTDRSTCKSFREVRVGDILIQIGDVKVSDLGFDSARDSGSALTKYFTELRTQTPMRLVFQRTEVMDWEGGVEL